MKLHIKILAALFSVFLISSCLYDNPNDLAQVVVDCDTTECFITIKPIVMTNCAIKGCHLPGGVGIGDFSIFSNFKNVANNGKLKYRINLSVTDPNHMPQNDSLTTVDKSTLNKWIDEGAPGCW